MTVPLMALAVGALVAGFVGIPPALGGHNAIEHFLEPSFAAPAAAAEPAPAEAPRGAAERGERPGAAEPGTLPATGELGLMLLSVMVAVGGLWGAHRVFVVSPRRAEAIAARWAAVHRLLSRKYYVDELYDATVVRGTLASARGLWTFDRRVIDGVVDGSSWTTRVSAWVSHLVDKYVVDGLVNLVGWLAGESSFVLRRVQTGLIQNYALVMLLGVFALVTLYVFAR
jgi:NADH-quinone oxidoreductase subunit L